MTYKINDFTSLTDHAVTLHHAQSWICAWKQATAGWHPDDNIKPNSFRIPIEDLQNLLTLAQGNKGTFVRAYLAVVDNEGLRESKLLLVPCKDGETDMVDEIGDTGLYTIYDLTSPCPPLCQGTSSELNAPCPDE